MGNYIKNALNVHRGNPAYSQWCDRVWCYGNMKPQYIYIYIHIYVCILYNGLAHHFIVPWISVHNCKKPVLVCRVLCFTTTWTMYYWCYACFSNFHVLFYLVSPSLVVVIFFIAQYNPIICMMIKEDNKVSVFCTFEDDSSSNPLSTQSGSNHSCVVWTLEN